MGVTSVSAWTGRREGKGREGPGSINIISSSAIHSRIGIRINIEIDIFPNHFIRDAISRSFWNYSCRLKFLLQRIHNFVSLILIF